MAWTSRTWLGLGAAIIVSVLFSVLDEFGFSPSVGIFGMHIWSSNLNGVFSTFAAMLVGGYVAREKFVVPAISFVFAVWLFIIYTTFSIAQVVENIRLLEVALDNVFNLLFLLFAACLGAMMGAAYYKEHQADGASAS